ncbi:MAG: threonyl-tRNA synthetase [Fusobacteria bacterium]|nr:MAG: threonyl-tRNA synthetase [Fusobacteriota bacterium]KAF0227917.1 MAG: threonyl-tRNA [Fusobacteriota bacterium]
MEIKLKDGKVLDVDSDSNLFDVASKISNRLKKEAIVAKVNGKMVDMSTKANDGDIVEIFTLDSEEGLDTYRHSSAHIMAEAVGELFPDVKFGIGPVIKDGFYYDFDTEHVFTPEDLEKIESKIADIVKRNTPFVRKVLVKEDALEYFGAKGEKYKVELIQDLPAGEEISVYEQGGFLDLCRGPHVPSTGYLKAYKLMTLAGAYWRGSEKNKMLQRIYATSFPNKKDLEAYLHRLEEAKKRDHRKLGAELELFTIEEEGPGFPIFLPKGMVLRNQLEDFMRGLYNKWEYEEIKTPIILNRKLWEQSGHWDHYKENMYFTKIDELDYAIKPMNCPGCMLVYRHNQHSYRELPIRYAEMGLVHRHEKSGVLHGLMRVRAFTQDDAHIFMLYDQIRDEIKKVIEMVDEVYNTFDFKYNVELSTRPEKAMGSVEMWDQATQALKDALDDLKIDYELNEGDGAFYGPKIDFHLEDSIGRTWQCGTIQLDFQMPEKFDLNYIGEDGAKHRPAMIHRAIFGSVERFIGILIEHYAGAFPLWLAPMQVNIIPVAEVHNEYAYEVAAELKRSGIRVNVDARNEKLGYRIRESQMQKIPYTFVVGDNETANSHVAVRKRSVGDLGSKPLSEVIEMLVTENSEKK